MARIVCAWTAALSLTVFSACSSKDEVTCPPGFGMCGGACIATVDDPLNCGGCGRTCGAGQACVASACVADCRAGLRGALQDRWGAWWDGLERPRASLADASTTCGEIGGRLPTATEIYRVSYAKGGDVGQSYQSNPLWTVVPRDSASQFAIRMNDGGTDFLGPATSQAYRCICPPADPVAFEGYACNGPPGEECVSLGGDGAGYNLDANDRALLTKGGAMWECGFQNAALPGFTRIADAIWQGAPNGSDGLLHIAEDVRYDCDAAVRWAGTETGWSASAKTIQENLATLRSFRCAGRASPASPATGRPADAFVGVGGMAADAADRAGDVWIDAHAECWAAGGHLAASTELGALVQQGLAGGSGSVLWTSDQVGWNGTQFLAEVLWWTGEAKTFGHYHSTYVSWAYKTDPAKPYRCIYYPVDPAFTAPTASCNQGCQEIAVPGPSGARLWFDSQDRAAALLSAAMNICAGQGGRLASERDYTEAIRAGLPNGTGSWVHTSDLSYGQNGGIRNQIVKWTNATFADQYAADSTWTEGLADASRPYRCVWTNELR